MRLLLTIALIWSTLGTALASEVQTSAGTVKIEKVMGGLDEPWGLTFLPGGGFLVTERDGRLIHVTGAGDRLRVKGAPKVAAKGQGGLLDVVAARDFAQSRTVFLSYSKRQSKGIGTALAAAELSADGRRLRNLRDLFVMQEGSSGGRHFGSRIVEGPRGHLFLTIGDRGDRPSAQDLGRHNGVVIRINRDGSIPADNPFVGRDGAQAEIWSFGHRNPQGAALDLKGRLWIHEHGARGGDEVNAIRKGANFGWPVIAYGRHYTGGKIGEGTKKAGMEQPAHFWDPSIAPSGMMIYSGKLWPAWKGDFFVGSLKFDLIARLEQSGSLAHVENLASGETARVRDVREAPDGSIWFLSVGEGAIFRITPAR